MFLFFAGCKKDDTLEASKVELKNNKIEKGWDYLKISAEYEYPEELVSINLCLSEKEDMSGAKTYKCDIEGKTFSVEVDELKDGTKYYYQFEYDNGCWKEKSKKENVATYAKPVVITNEVTNKTPTSATLNGNVVCPETENKITVKGFCWGTEPGLTTEGTHTNNGTEIGTYSFNLSNLTPNTTYYVRAYATNKLGTAYGEEISFTTLEETNEIYPPTVTTAAVTEIGQTAVLSGGEVTSDGGADVTARGVCWSTSQNPTISDSHTTDDSGTGSYVSNLSNLTPNTKYYVRAYATNSAGTGYGEERSFTTLENVELPTVTTTNVTNITETTATCGGNVISDGGADVTARGVCWSTSHNPTISDSHTTDASGTGSYVSNLSNLTPNTKYYVRAYATNSAGTSYGTQKSFTTLENVEPPTVTTTNVTNITETTATCGGNVTSDGGADVTARGVCWSTSQNPTIDDNKTENGSGTGSYVSNLSNLTPNTKYYVRAYATNSAGTGYGNEVSFTTLENVELPTLTTTNVTSITETTATCGGNVTSDGGATVTARGVCWSTSHNPTISDSHTTDASGTGSYVSNLSNLTPNTKYYVRAYATNSAGTGYGEERSFTTLEEEPFETQTITVNGVSFTMIAVEGGTFQMGATSEQGGDAYDNEYPVHSVTLSDYYIGETEVTQELWEAVMVSNPSYFSGSQRPVERVSWNDCQEFITQLNQLTGKNFRLPTEAEWEYAARGGDNSQGYKYSGSNTIGNVAWYCDNSNSQTHNVKTKSPNELGIYDMSGNVLEWCQDWYGNYSSGSQTNPTGPSSGSYRVGRGAGWDGIAAYCRVSCRDGIIPGSRYYFLGLRLCLSQ